MYDFSQMEAREKERAEVAALCETLRKKRKKIESLHRFSRRILQDLSNSQSDFRWGDDIHLCVDCIECLETIWNTYVCSRYIGLGNSWL